MTVRLSLYKAMVSRSVWEFKDYMCVRKMAVEIAI
jgi:hypothetical protein